jgi:formate dehydrogenase subunit gamma
VSGAASNRLVRYSLRERVVHAAAALSYVYLLLTGLAFWTPALYWIAMVLGGGFLSRLLHPWVGVIFTLAVARMFALWRRDMRTTDQDRAWRRAIGSYIRNEDDRVPGAGRFNLGQKQLFWVMVWGALLLLASGVVLWLPEAVPWSLRAIREAALLVHAVSALATIGAFIVHLYMGLVVVPGGLHAILRGEVSEQWARHHHPLWADEVMNRRAPSRSSTTRQEVGGGGA